jgi:C1A family cysteine protease
MKFLQSALNYIKSLFTKKAIASVVAHIEHQLSGWIPDPIDPRDKVFGLANTDLSSVDLRPLLSPVDQQGTINSCVSHAVTTALETVLKTSDLSRLFVYYNARALEGRTAIDAGCQIRNAIKGVVMNGAAQEFLWGYNTSQLAVKPTAPVYTNAATLKARIGYAQVKSLDSLKAALASGFPVVFGFSVPQTFATQTKYDGFLPYPVTGVKFIGAHAVLAVGYDDARGVVICRNSFGINFGKSGYFEMPYQWFANMAGLVTDAWVLSPKV